MNDYRDLKRYVFAPGILEIYTNSPKLYDFKFGIPWLCERQPSFFSAPCQVSLEWQEVKDIRSHLKDYQKEGLPYVFLERPLTFGKRVQIFLQWRGNNKPNVRLLTNKEYFHWSSLRLTSASHYPLPGALLSNVACVALLEADYAPVHCACVELNGTGVLLVAPSDTGKTFTTQTLVQSHGFRFVAEDMAITNGQEIVGCPYTGTGIPGQNPSHSFLGRLRRLAFHLCFKGGLRFRDSLVSTLKTSSILPKTSIDYIVFLKRGKNRIINMDKKKAARLLFKSNRLEFPYLTDRFLLQLWHQYDVPNMEQALKKEQELLTSLVSQTKTVISISARKAENFAFEINNFLRESG